MSTHTGVKEGTGIGLKDSERKGVAKILNALLADEYVLYTKTRNFHWNVTGPNFQELHTFFQGQYEALDEIIDQVAERVRALDERPVATLDGFLELARLKEDAGELKAAEMTRILLEDHEAVIRQMREDIDEVDDRFHDAGNADEITGWLKQHEQMAWMLRSLCG